MTLIVPNEGELLLGKRALNHTAADNVVLRLYSNDVTPAAADTVATYTEVVVAGYAAKTLTGASWSWATVSGKAEGSYAEQTFTFTAAGSAYGWFLTNAAGTTLLAAERFATAPQTIGAANPISVTPKLTFSSEA
jgi:hypothetical protein